MQNKIKTAVLPVAGLGTRFLPVTKAGPKEMLPIVDRPLIQYVVEEAIAIGITQLVLVTSSGKRAIEDYFDSNYELESRLEQCGKLNSLKTIKEIIPDNVHIVYVRQPEPLGLGDAVLRAKHVVGNAPFAVLLADDVMNLGHRACLQKMAEIYARTNSSVLAVQRVPRSETKRYGIVSLNESGQEADQILSIVEKPEPAIAPSTLGVTGRYILNPIIFKLLEETEKGVGGEIQLTDAIAKLLAIEPVTACRIEGQRYDCGSSIGLLEATIDFALKRDELRQQLLAYLQVVVEREIKI